MTARSLIAAVSMGLALAACRGGSTEAPPPAAAQPKAGAKAAADRNACHLLTHQEVSALVERKVVMADQSEAGDTFSTCDWEDGDGTFAFGLTVYWSGGKQQWETWRLAQGLGDAAFKKAEGVAASDVVRQGPVQGIGDAAYFSEVLPSLVLKDDTLFELKLSQVPRSGAKFAELAGKLLAKAP